MALVGIPTAFLGAVLADLRGTDETRRFTRPAFAVVVAIEIGGPIGSVLIDVAAYLAGVL
jgi:hypothetical protein